MCVYRIIVLFKHLKNNELSLFCIKTSKTIYKHNVLKHTIKMKLTLLYVTKEISGHIQPVQFESFKLYKAIKLLTKSNSHNKFHFWVANIV